MLSVRLSKCLSVCWPRALSRVREQERAFMAMDPVTTVPPAEFPRAGGRGRVEWWGLKGMGGVRGSPSPAHLSD